MHLTVCISSPHTSISLPVVGQLCSSPQDEAIDTAEERGKAARVLTGRCWMAEGFPMSLRQLLPILDIIGTANKHLARVAKFMQKYADMELFPVKLQVCRFLS